MLFSDEEIANLINTNFEPVWQMVKPVPIIRIDFGNGRQFTRTLHGNVASYVCTSDGRVVDLLPGIYEPTRYKQSLTTLADIARTCMSLSPRSCTEHLSSYHSGEIDRINRELLMDQIVSFFGAHKRKGAPRVAKAATAKDLANWEKMFDDTRANETFGRKEAHTILAANPGVRPDQVTKQVYMQILHVDLDDPYMGLGPALLDAYPF